MDNSTTLAAMFCVHAVNRGLLPVSDPDRLKELFEEWWLKTSSLLTSQDRIKLGLEGQVVTPASSRLPSVIKTPQSWDELRSLVYDLVKYENNMLKGGRMGKPDLSGTLDGFNPSVLTTGLFTVREMIKGRCEHGAILFASSICLWSKPQMQGFILACIRSNPLRRLQVKVNRITSSPSAIELYGNAQHAWALKLFFEDGFAIPLGGEMLLAGQIKSSVCDQILRQRLIANIGFDLTEYEKIFSLSFIGNGIGEF